MHFNITQDRGSSTHFDIFDYIGSPKYLKKGKTYHEVPLPPTTAGGVPPTSVCQSYSYLLRGAADADYKEKACHFSAAVRQVVHKRWLAWPKRQNGL